MYWHPVISFLARPSKVTFGFRFPPLGRGRLKCSPERAQIKARALSQRGGKRIGAALQYFPVQETFQTKGVPLIGAGLPCLVVLWWDSFPDLPLGQNPRALNARWEVLIASDEKGLWMWCRGRWLLVLRKLKRVLHTLSTSQVPGGKVKSPEKLSWH